MKNQAIEQTYVVLKQERGLSKVTGHPYVKITLVGTRDRDEYVTYIDHANHNHKNWFHITNNPEHGFVLQNLRIKQHKDRMLVDADSKPIIAAEDPTPDRIFDTLRDVWREQDERGKNNYRNLFE